MTEPAAPPAPPYETPELTPIDLQTYTQGRLLATDPNTKFVLGNALQQVRNYCKWHVTPVRVNETLTFDGPGEDGALAVGTGGLYYASGSYLTGVLRRTRPGGETLYLPTKRLLGITTVVEHRHRDDIEGHVIDEHHLDWSEHGEVRKRNGVPWPRHRRSIEVTFTHGYDIEESIDWRRLVLAMADRMSLVRGLTGPFPTAIGPYKVEAYFGTSRTGSLPMTAGWLDDLLAQIDVPRYVRLPI
jgi:hypothetical protein